MMGEYISRAEAEGLLYVCLGLFCATDKPLCQADTCMSVGQISIQRQRPFTFGNALDPSVRQHLGVAQGRMGESMFGGQRQRLCQCHLRYRVRLRLIVALMQGS